MNTPDLFETLVHYTLDVMAVIHYDGTIAYKTPSTERLLGYAPADLVGRNHFDFIHPDDLERVRRAFDDVVRRGGPSQLVEYRVRHSDGSWRTVESLGRVCPDLAGGPFAVVTSRDVTDRKTLEARLLQTEQLQAISLAAGSVAHDLNNLLTAISGYVELILRHEAADSPRRDVVDLKEAVERAMVLTRQLLLVGRSKPTQRLRSIDANRSIKELTGLFRRIVGRGVSLRYVLGAVNAVVPLDRGLLDQVIVNLVLNARDAMPSGGVLTIRTSNVVSDNAQHVVLEIIDQGVGMTPEIKSRIFEPFFTTKAPGVGTGLGLPTVARIVGEAGGRIEIVSEEQKGTTVRIVLPTADR